MELSLSTSVFEVINSHYLNVISESSALAPLLLLEALLNEANDTAQQITHTINTSQSTV